MSKVVVIGGAGAPNYGDELIVKGWLLFFRKFMPNSEVVFFENIAKNATKLHGETNLISFQDDLVQIAKNIKNLTFWQQVKRGYSFFDKDGFNKYKDKEISVLLEADFIHLHGGGYLNNFDPEKGFYIGLLASLNEKLGKKVFATGIGFGPVQKPTDEKNRVLINNIFSKFDAFELRDIENFRFLSDWFPDGKFIYGLDDCYLMDINEIVTIDSTKSRLYLSFLSYNIDKMSENSFQNIIEFANSFDEVVFFESYPWEDKHVFTKLQEKISNIKLLSVDESIGNKFPVSSNDYVICSRFHVHFVLSRANVQGVYLKDSKYYSVKHQSIVDRGSRMKFSDFDDIELKKLPMIKSYISLQDDKYHKQKIEFVRNLYNQP